jgi:hypothetical protein
VKLVWRSFNALVRERGDHHEAQAEH